MQLLKWFGSLSVRAQWISILVLWCVSIAIATAFTAYRITYSSVEADTLTSLASDNLNLSAALSADMNHRRDRLHATLQLIDTSCGISGGMNRWCAHDLLRDFLRKEHAKGTVLSYSKGRSLKVGKRLDRACGGESPCFFMADHELRLELGSKDEESGSTLTAAYGVEELAASVGRHAKDNGSLFVAVDGDLQTVATSSVSSSIPQDEVLGCILGANSAYAASVKVPFYRAYSAVPELDGICVMQAVPAESVLAPVHRLERRLLKVGALFAVFSIFFAWLISLGTAKSIKRLQRRIAAFKEDQVLRPLPSEGPREVRALSSAFDTMARSLQTSRAELQASERSLALAYRAASLWIWEHDLAEGRITWRDPLRKENHRTSSLLAFVRLIHPEDRAVVIAALREASASGAYAAEYRVPDPSGYSWKYSWGQVVKDDNTGRDMLVGVTADTSSRKEAERLHGERERMVATTEMAASLAHEINNPLTSVIGALYMAKITPERDAKLAKYLNMAESEAKRVADIVRRLLQIYREPTHAVSFDAGQIWKSMIDACHPQLERKSQSVVLKATPARMVGFIDELRHGFNNLLMNAMAGSPSGSTIQVRVRIGTSWKRGAPAVRIFMRDEREGIPANEIDHVFDPFMRTSVQRGTGLGLWVTRAAVVKQGGSIRIRSAPEGKRGSCVLIVLPVRAPV